MSRVFLYVVGTRPNFMKIAPLLSEMRRTAPEDEHLLLHTGQHYDQAMSQLFFSDLGLPRPDHHLEVGSGAPGLQTARVVEGVERVILDRGVDAVVVPGDVNSTLGAALAAAKQGVPIAHVEAGLRSFDPEMPEELNRVLTDRMSEVLLTHSPEASENLAREGIARERVHFVGNTMIDTLVRVRDRLAPPSPDQPPYVLVTLHRPALVDGPLLGEVLGALDALASQVDVVFPMHPRTRAAMAGRGIAPGRVRLLPPLGYLEFTALQRDATAVLTDSGGVQEETTFLGVPCFTLRDNTERPVTVEHGTNTLLGLRPERIAELPELLRARPPRPPELPPGWDGAAALRAAPVVAAMV